MGKFNLLKISHNTLSHSEDWILIYSSKRECQDNIFICTIYILTIIDSMIGFKTETWELPSVLT